MEYSSANPKLRTESKFRGQHQTTIRMDEAEVYGATRGFRESYARGDSQGIQTHAAKIGSKGNHPPHLSGKSAHSTALHNDPRGLVKVAKGNRHHGRNTAMLADGSAMGPQVINGQLAASSKTNTNSWFDTDDKHIYLRSTPFTFNVPGFQHNPIRLVKSDLVNATNMPDNMPEPKRFDSSIDSSDWTALQWATTEGAGGLSSDPTDSSDNAREQLADSLCDWLKELGYSSHSLGELVSEGDFVRDYRQQADERPERPPSPVDDWTDDWTDVYRTLSNRRNQSRSHDTFKAQDADGMSDAMSLMSYAESIFDAATTMSTASSVPGDTQELISKFVNLLVRDTSVARMLSIASSDTGMGHERLRRNFSRILRSYSRELRRSLEKDKPEKNDSSYGQAIAFISRKAPHASNLIVSRFSQARTSAPPRFGLLESDGDSSSESEESEAENEIFNMENLESFFTAGEPFRLLKWKLRALIIPDSFLSRVKISAEKLIHIASVCGLTGLLSKAQQQTDKSLKCFWADFTKEIERLARNLRAQCNTLGQVRIADFLLVYSQYVAARLEESLATEREPEGQEELSSDGLLQDIFANTLPEVWEVDFPAQWRFIASTKAFQEFFSDLRDLVYPTLLYRAEKLIAKWDEPEGQRLLPILAELRWVIGRLQGEKKEASSFSISPQDDSLRDRLKLAVEASTGAEWDWWPFCSPPRHQGHNLPGGELLSWRCVSLYLL